MGESEEAVEKKSRVSELLPILIFCRRNQQISVER